MRHILRDECLFNGGTTAVSLAGLFANRAVLTSTRVLERTWNALVVCIAKKARKNDEIVDCPDFMLVPNSLLIATQSNDFDSPYATQKVESDN
jgi:hypothetical protein